jgi:hypothetical protein
LQVLHAVRALQLYGWAVVLRLGPPPLPPGWASRTAAPPGGLADRLCRHLPVSLVRLLVLHLLLLPPLLQAGPRLVVVLPSRELTVHTVARWWVRPGAPAGRALLPVAHRVQLLLHQGLEWSLAMHH